VERSVFDISSSSRPFVVDPSRERHMSEVLPKNVEVEGNLCLCRTCWSVNDGGGCRDSETHRDDINRVDFGDIQVWVREG